MQPGASLELSDLSKNKYEVLTGTFAAPPSLTREPSACEPHMDFKKHYRFGKGLYKDALGGFSGLIFDPVPFVGTLDTYSVGEFIMLSSEDKDNVAYAGFESSIHTFRYIIASPRSHST